MMNDIKINGALHDVIGYMQEDGCEDLGEPIKHNGKEYYVSISKSTNKRGGLKCKAKQSKQIQ